MARLDEQSEPPQSHAEPACFVYFIQHGDYGPVKIGVAADPEQRRRELQTGNPEQLAIRATVPGGRTLEVDLHRRFKDWHIQGEWFGGGERSAVILAYAAGLKDASADYAAFAGIAAEGAVEFTSARHPISERERLDLRYDIERLWLRRHTPAEIAEELCPFWLLSEAEVKREIEEMRKSSVWDVRRQPPQIRCRAIRGTAA
jgi:hypothetical protein